MAAAFLLSFGGEGASAISDCGTANFINKSVSEARDYLTNGCLNLSFGVDEVGGHTGNLRMFKVYGNNVNISDAGSTWMMVTLLNGTQYYNKNAATYDNVTVSDGVIFREYWTNFGGCKLNITAYIKLYNNLPQIDFWSNYVLNDTTTNCSKIQNVVFPSDAPYINISRNFGYFIVSDGSGYLVPSNLVNTSNKAISTMTIPAKSDMQLTGFQFNDSEISNLSLAIYSLDTTGSWKEFIIGTADTGMHGYWRTTFNVFLNSTDWSGTYSGLVNYTTPVTRWYVLNGTYNEVAQQYATWARSQSWAQTNLTYKSSQKSSISNIANTGILYKRNLGSSTTFNKTTELMNNLTNYYNAKAPVMFSGYWKGSPSSSCIYDTGYPDTDSICPGAGGSTDMVNSIKSINNSGYPVILFYNNVMWDNTTTSYNSSWAVIWNGLNTNWAYNLTVMTPSAIATFIPNKTNTFYQTYNISGFYFDGSQTTKQPIKDNNTIVWDKYGTIFNDTWYRGMREMSTYIYNNDTTKLMGGEQGSELYIDQFDIGFGSIKLTSSGGYMYSGGSIRVPLYQIVYHDKIMRAPHIGDLTVTASGSIDTNLKNWAYLLGAPQWLDVNSLGASKNNAVASLITNSTLLYRLIWNANMSDSKILNISGTNTVQSTTFDNINETYRVFVILDNTTSTYSGTITTKHNDVWDLWNHNLTCQDCASFSYNVPSGGVKAFVNANISAFTLSPSGLATLKDTSNNTIDDQVPAQITTATPTSITFNSSQNYTGTNWQIAVLGDMTGKTWYYKGHNDVSSTAIPSANLTFNGTHTLFNLININVYQASNSNVLSTCSAGDVGTLTLTRNVNYTISPASGSVAWITNISSVTEDWYATYQYQPSGYVTSGINRVILNYFSTFLLLGVMALLVYAYYKI